MEQFYETHSAPNSETFTGRLINGTPAEDIYVFSANFGSDVISETVGNNVIKFTSGITPDQIRTHVDVQGSLHLYVGNSSLRIEADDTITPKRTDIGQRIQQISFADGTVWDLTAGLFLNDRDVGDHIYGTDYEDTILGNGGNDSLYGYSGNDNLNGGEGNDVYMQTPEVMF